jgi:hypothetical protein
MQQSDSRTGLPCNLWLHLQLHVPSSAAFMHIQADWMREQAGCRMEGREEIGKKEKRMDAACVRINGRFGRIPHSSMSSWKCLNSDNYSIVSRCVIFKMPQKFRYSLF